MLEKSSGRSEAVQRPERQSLRSEILQTAWHRPDHDWSKERWTKLPHETVAGIIRDTLAERKTHWETHNGKGTFDPIISIGEHFTNISSWRQFRNGEELRMMSLPWDALTQPHIKSPSYRNIISGLVRDVSRIHGRHITLSPTAVKLLDALIDAVDVGVPHKRGDRTVDLFANLPGLIAGHRPLEEPKRAKGERSEEWFSSDADDSDGNDVPGWFSWLAMLIA